MLSGAALPVFLVAVLLVVGFGAGGVLPLFPLRGLMSGGLGAAPRLLNGAWHLVLPIMAVSAGGIAGLALLMRHATLEALGTTYMMAMRVRGTSERCC
jgi:microcin C transport system permease protein